MSHPASGVSGNRRPPECFDVSVHRALPPSQHSQHGNNRDRYAKDEITAGFEGASQIRNTRGGERDRSNARQILVMVRDKGVTKCVEHDEAQDWAECRDEKQCGDFQAASGVAPDEEDRRA